MSVDWSLLSHEEIYARVQQGPGAGAAQAAEDAWAAAIGAVERSETLLYEVMNSGCWEGRAADAARESVRRLADWTVESAVGAQQSLRAVQGQAYHAADVRAQIEPPRTAEWNALVGQLILSPDRLTRIDDAVRLHREMTLAEERAVDVMTAYTQAAEERSVQLGGVTAPPAVTVASSAAAPDGAGWAGGVGGSSGTGGGSGAVGGGGGSGAVLAGATPAGSAGAAPGPPGSGVTGLSAGAAPPAGGGAVAPGAGGRPVSGAAAGGQAGDVRAGAGQVANGRSGGGVPNGVTNGVTNGVATGTGARPVPTGPTARPAPTPSGGPSPLTGGPGVPAQGPATALPRTPAGSWSSPAPVGGTPGWRDVVAANRPGATPWSGQAAPGRLTHAPLVPSEPGAPGRGTTAGERAAVLADAQRGATRPAATTGHPGIYPPMTGAGAANQNETRRRPPWLLDTDNIWDTSHIPAWPAVIKGNDGFGTDDYRPSGY